jgi:hypothetical protein
MSSALRVDPVIASSIAFGVMSLAIMLRSE